MSADAGDSDSLIAAEILVRLLIDEDGVPVVQVDISEEFGEIPPLVTLLGMLELAKGAAERAAQGGAEF